MRTLLPYVKESSMGRICRVDTTDTVDYAIVKGPFVPVSQGTESNETDMVKFHRNLVTCLNNLYKLSSSCGRDNLSNHLAVNGYLKYFLLLTTRLP